MNESLQFILKEMCNRVGADFKSIDFQDGKWYLSYEWTEEESKQFEKWLSDYLYNNTKARKEIMTITVKRRRYTNEAAQWFTFMYGWKFFENKNSVGQNV